MVLIAVVITGNLIGCILQVVTGSQCGVQQFIESGRALIRHFGIPDGRVIRIAQVEVTRDIDKIDALEDAVQRRFGGAGERSGDFLQYHAGGKALDLDGNRSSPLQRRLPNSDGRRGDPP